MHRNLFLYLPGFLLLLLGACTNDSKSPANDTISAADSTKKDTVLINHIDTIYLPDSTEKAIVFPDKALSKWVNFYKKQYRVLDPHVFIGGYEHHFSLNRPQPFTAPKTHDDSLAQQLYCWSPDRKYFVDIYSVRYFFETTNGRTTLQGGDPESGICLTSLKEKTTWLIQYTGNMQSYEDVAWIDSTRFVVTGATDLSGDSLQLNYQLFDIARKRVAWFESVAVPRKKGKPYLCTKFPEYCAE